MRRPEPGAHPGPHKPMRGASTQSVAERGAPRGGGLDAPGGAEPEPPGFAPAAAPDATRPSPPASGLCPAVDSLVELGVPAARAALRARLSERLSALFEARCASLVAARLQASPGAVREALLQERAGHADAVGRLLAGLHPAEAIGIMAPAQDEAGRALVRSFLLLPQRSLREAALDGRGRSGQDDPAGVAGLDRECLVALRAGLTRLGLESAHLNEPGTGRPGEPDAGPCDEGVFLALLRRGAEQAAIDCLARAAQIDATLVERAVSMRDPRALVSLAWKAGYSMQAASRLQSELAGIPPGSALRATATGACPLGRGEMAWQLRELVQTAV